MAAAAGDGAQRGAGGRVATGRVLAVLCLVLGAPAPAAAQTTSHADAVYHAGAEGVRLFQRDLTRCEDFQCRTSTAPACACDLKCSGLYLVVSRYESPRDGIAFDPASGFDAITEQFVTLRSTRSGEEQAHITIRIESGSRGTLGMCAAMLGALRFRTSSTSNVVRRVRANFGGGYYDSGIERFYAQIELPGGGAGGWEAAQTLCSSPSSLMIGPTPGYLATPLSREEDIVLRAVTTKSGWLGGTNHGRSALFRWMTGPQGCVPYDDTDIGPARTACGIFPISDPAACSGAPGACTGGLPFAAVPMRGAVVNAAYCDESFKAAIAALPDDAIRGAVMDDAKWVATPLDANIPHAFCEWGAIDGILLSPTVLVHDVAILVDTSIDECCVDCIPCATCAGDACHAGYQMCFDPIFEELNNWECRCVIGKGRVTAAAATCAIDECVGSADLSAQLPANVCAAAGQNCVDPNPTPGTAMLLSLGAMQVASTGPGSLTVGQGPCGSDETCAFGLRCRHQSIVFEAHGVRPPTRGTVFSVCMFPYVMPVDVVAVPPASGKLLGLRQGHCADNSDCETGLYCMEEGGFNPGFALSKGPPGLRVCYAKARKVVVQSQQLGLGEGPCMRHTDCRVGLRCFERNAVNSPEANRAVGVDTRDVDADLNVCYFSLSFMFDLDSGATGLNDWTCVCRSPTSGAPGVASPAVCLIDECLTPTDICGTCAGTTCSAAAQLCNDPNPDPIAHSDWVCMCNTTLDPAGGTLLATRRPADCIDDDLDECDGTLCGTCRTDATCPDDLYTCADPDLSARGDWVCACRSPAEGEATGGRPTCVGRDRTQPTAAPLGTGAPPVFATGMPGGDATAAPTVPPGGGAPTAGPSSGAPGPPGGGGAVGTDDTVASPLPQRPRTPAPRTSTTPAPVRVSPTQPPSTATPSPPSRAFATAAPASDVPHVHTPPSASATWYIVLALAGGVVGLLAVAGGVMLMMRRKARPPDLECTPRRPSDGTPAPPASLYTTGSTAKSPAGRGSSTGAWLHNPLVELFGSFASPPTTPRATFVRETAAAPSGHVSM